MKHYSFPSAPRQRGASMLMVVLAIGAIMLVVSTTTLMSVRGSSKESGMQRMDFQDINAAEAGVALTQSRFNSAVRLCSGYFSKNDYDSVVAQMTAITYTLPSSYGPTRAVRVDNFQVVPGRPMRINFRSTGGRWTGGAFSSVEGSHSINATLRMATLGDYSSFIEVQQQRIAGGLTQSGKVYADTLHFLGSTGTYLKEVYYGNAVIYDSGKTGMKFMKGEPKKLSNPFTLARIYIDDATGSTCGAKTYKDLAAGTVTGEGAGFSYTGTKDIYIPLDSIKTSGANVVLKYYEVDTLLSPMRRPPLAGNKSLDSTTPLGTWSVLSGNFNGIIYAANNIFLSDTLRNFSLTITGGKDMYATDNIRCIGNETSNPNNRVTLGMLTKLRYHFWNYGPTSLIVEGIISVPDSNWWWGGDEWTSKTKDSTTHFGKDTLGNPCVKSSGGCWYLRLLGGSITRRGNGVGTLFSQGGNRRYEYDPDNMYSPPPKFPALYGQSGGVPVWTVADWAESN